MRYQLITLPSLTFLFIMLLVTCGNSLAVTTNQNSLVTLSGTVVDRSGAAIQGTHVQLTNIATKVQYEDITDDYGIYRFTGLTPGKYEIVARASGFSKEKFTVNIKTNKEREFNIKLPPFGYGTERVVEALDPEEKSKIQLCELHKVKMKIDIVRIEYGLMILGTGDDIQNNNPQLVCDCPNSNKLQFGGCEIGQYTHIEVFYCPVCRKNEAKLFKKLEKLRHRNKKE